MESMQNEHRVAYIYSKNLIEQINKVSKVRDRANLVNTLIYEYDLFKHLKVISPKNADDELLNMFHSKDYIECLKKYSKVNDEEKVLCDDEFGLGYDCPFIENLYEFCCTIGGASLTAAQIINLNRFKYVINWFGGWHHAKREKANGYCYVNDIVLCILKLREKFNRILYIDMDLHHGDGVQEAFEFSDKIMTLSLHRYSPGFYPGTGSIDEIGKGKGKYYSINVPLNGGINDEMYKYLFSNIINEINNVFKPEVIVCQCGADSLYGDTCDTQNPFNLTTYSYGKCIKMLIDLDIPTIFLGGGGYNFANTARLWCYITSILTNQTLDNDIPEHEYFLEYAPDYELHTSASKAIKNKNTEEYAEKILSKILENLNMIRQVELVESLGVHVE